MNIRRARLEDIIQMQHCNLLCLAENYNIKYYLYVLLSWPQLSHVAENDKGNCVGYALAKMEEEKTTKQGNVVSLAVKRGYRQCGLARKLMSLTIQTMVDCFQATSVVLHVRKSNHIAFNLYSSLEFKIMDTEPGYYKDGEDAYTMKKNFSQIDAKQHSGKNEDEDIVLWIDSKGTKTCINKKYSNMKF